MRRKDGWVEGLRWSCNGGGYNDAGRCPAGSRGHLEPGVAEVPRKSIKVSSKPRLWSLLSTLLHGDKLV